MYSAFEENRIIIGYFFKNHEIDIQSILNTKIVVDCACFMFSIQLESIYQERLVILLLG